MFNNLIEKLTILGIIGALKFIVSTIEKSKPLKKGWKGTSFGFILFKGFLFNRLLNKSIVSFSSDLLKTGSDFIIFLNISLLVSPTKGG